MLAALSAATGAAGASQQQAAMLAALSAQATGSSNSSAAASSPYPVINGGNKIMADYSMYLNQQAMAAAMAAVVSAQEKGHLTVVTPPPMAGAGPQTATPKPQPAAAKKTPSQGQKKAPNFIQKMMTNQQEGSSAKRLRTYSEILQPSSSVTVTPISSAAPKTLSVQKPSLEVTPTLSVTTLNAMQRHNHTPSSLTAMISPSVTLTASSGSKQQLPLSSIKLHQSSNSNKDPGLGANVLPASTTITPRPRGRPRLISNQKEKVQSSSASKPKKQPEVVEIDDREDEVAATAAGPRTSSNVEVGDAVAVEAFFTWLVGATSHQESTHMAFVPVSARWAAVAHGL